MWCLETTLFLVYYHKIMGGGMVDLNYVPWLKLLLSNIYCPTQMSVIKIYIIFQNVFFPLDIVTWFFLYNNFTYIYILKIVGSNCFIRVSVKNFGYLNWQFCWEEIWQSINIGFFLADINILFGAAI